MSDQDINNFIHDFLRHLNYDDILFENDPFKIAIHVRNNTTIKTLTGQDLLKYSIERDFINLQGNNESMIGFATTNIWDSHLTDFERNKFMNIVNQVNDINQDYAQASGDSRIRMLRLNNLQEASSLFQQNLFNGTSFM